jgi:DNA invertase Pin-like site-specific DNA recombinase
MLAVIGAVAQAEREAMLERQGAGVAKAKARGHCKGPVPTARRQGCGNHQAQRGKHQAVGNHQQAGNRKG